MGRESEITDLRGEGKVAVVGGRSGIVLSRESGLRGNTGCHAGLRFEECKRQTALLPTVDILGLATALRAATTIRKIVFVFVFVFCSDLERASSKEHSFGLQVCNMHDNGDFPVRGN
jgi:hypothetical protein